MTQGPQGVSGPLTTLTPGHSPLERKKLLQDGAVMTVEGPEGGYRLQGGRVLDWWGTNPPWVLFVGDYSQLEIRLLAHVSKDETLINAVLAGEDIHALTAQACFDEIPKDISLDEVKRRFPELRAQAKPINFGVIYGMGPMKLAEDIGVSEDEARDIIEVRYMGRFPGVKQYIERTHELAKKFGAVRTALGRPRHLPAAKLDPKDRQNKRFISQACRQAQNAPIQGFAADIITVAMRDIRAWLRGTVLGEIQESLMPARDGSTPPLTAALSSVAALLLQVHDELVGEAHPAVANYFRDGMVARMEKPGNPTPITLRVPLVVDAKLGADWYSTKG